MKEEVGRPIEAPPVVWAGDNDRLDYCDGNGEGSGHIRDIIKK